MIKRNGHNKKRGGKVSGKRTRGRVLKEVEKFEKDAKATRAWHEFKREID